MAEPDQRPALPPPPLSVVVPALNEAEYIGDTLRGLQPMRGLGAEVIVVDGGSTDLTIEVAQPLADRVLRCEQGRALQMNLGARLARGDVFVFLHADTRLPDGAMRAILDGMAGSGRCWGFFRVQIEGRPFALRLVASMMNLRSRLSRIGTGDQAIFVSRASFHAVGGFRPLPLMEDIELSAALRRHSRPLCLPHKVVTSGRRWLAGGVWRTVGLMWALRLLFGCGVQAARLARYYR